MLEVHWYDENANDYRDITAPASFVPGTVDGTWELLYGDLSQTGRGAIPAPIENRTNGDSYLTRLRLHRTKEN